MGSDQKNDIVKSEAKKIVYGEIECNLLEVMRDLTGVGQGRWLDKMGKAKKRSDQLKMMMDNKLLPVQITEDSARCMGGFYKAMASVYDLMGHVDAKGHVDNIREANVEMADKGSKANCAMVDFFIKLENKYQLGAEVINLLDKVLIDGELQREMDGASYPDFSTGVYAMVVAYLNLRKSHPEYKWRAASPEEDRRGGGDLVGEKGEGKEMCFCFAEVKAGNYVTRRAEFDLDDSGAREGILEMVKGQRIQPRVERTLRKMLDIKSRIGSGEKDKYKYIWVYEPAGRNRVN